VPPAEKLDVTVEPLAGALVLRPAAVRYNEQLPVVVWIEEHPFRWSDARAALIRNARVAVAVVKRQPDTAFWNELGKTKWIDMKRMYVVGALVTRHSALETIIEDRSVPEGLYRANGNELRVRGIQSFAAGYIAQELKTNGFR